MPCYECAMDEGPIVAPPPRPPLAFVPIFRLISAFLGHVPMPARLLAHASKSALAAGVLEAFAPGKRDMHATDGERLLAITRIVAARSAGCPFCVDMNVAVAPRVGLSAAELRALLSLDESAFADELGPRGAAVASYVRDASRPGGHLTSEVVRRVKAELDDHDLVVVAATLASVHFWSRFSQALRIPDEGFARAAGVHPEGTG